MDHLPSPRGLICETYLTISLLDLLLGCTLVNGEKTYYSRIGEQTKQLFLTNVLLFGTGKLQSKAHVP